MIVFLLSIFRFLTKAIISNRNYSYCICTSFLTYEKGTVSVFSTLFVNFIFLLQNHLKMGLIRSKNTNLTVEDEDKLTDYLWAIV